MECTRESQGETTVAASALTGRAPGRSRRVKKALEGDAVYMALVASQKRSKLVLEYALSAGVPADKLERVRAPAGLDLGASTPEEIALSIMSEIIAVRRGATGQPLRDRLQKGPKESASVAKVISQCET